MGAGTTPIKITIAATTPSAGNGVAEETQRANGDQAEYRDGAPGQSTTGAEDEALPDFIAGEINTIITDHDGRPSFRDGPPMAFRFSPKIVSLAVVSRRIRPLSRALSHRPVRLSTRMRLQNLENSILNC